MRPIHEAGVIAQPSGDLLVLFQMDTGEYYSLNECGSRIWSLCDGTRSVSEIVGVVSSEYDGPPGVAEDISSLLDALSERRLLTTAGQESK